MVFGNGDRWRCCAIEVVVVMFENDGVGYGCDGGCTWW